MRYYFHIEDGSRQPDEVGVEFETLGQAQEEGVRTLGACIADRAGPLERPDRFKMIVTDAHGVIQFTLGYSATLRFSASEPSGIL